MEIGVVGVGRGGTALATALAGDEADRRVDYLAGTVAVDTDAADLAAATSVAEDDRHLLGAVHTDGAGTGGDVELAAEIAREQRPELQAAVDGLPVGRVDATLVCAALGGGTGAGVAPAVADLLGQITGTPVYGVGIVPGVAEVGGDGDAAGSTEPRRDRETRGDADGDRPLSSNAAGGVRALSAACDDLVLADLDVWRANGEAYAPAWDRLDAAVAGRLGALCAAGEATDPTPERVLDASELTNTLGAGGVTVVGTAGSGVDNGRREGTVGGLLDRLTGETGPEVDAGEAVSIATNASRKAVTHRLSLPCAVDSARRAAVVFHAPPEWLNRRGLERARALIEEETAVPEIRWGDRPDPSAEEFRVTVALSGVAESDRLTALGAGTDPGRLG
ncbi:hypothetical protein Hbl1158_11535 [Halobaculum sp. CBA1158]|uniref:hypothetical protein n=1 Tax=Halobaculum sp. CBA1158 TaxID=2904243 RepID=UPI001F1C629A|nr:hypothetical protein [Halobaculum sp. CBA1158]UIO99162.1 hypothetical protein Hbl1158_11535 [Halobaculum sp. CBA1158]